MSVAAEELLVVTALLTVVMDAAAEELLFVMDVCNPSIRNAAELLFVVTVPLSVVTDAFNEADVV